MCRYFPGFRQLTRLPSMHNILLTVKVLSGLLQTKLFMNKNFLYKYFEPNAGISWHRRLRRTLVLFIFCAAFFEITILSSCRQSPKQEKHSAKSEVYYTCSMHPQVMLDH